MNGSLLVFLEISGDVNAITIPPCEYGCKTETKKISRQAGVSAVSSVCLPCAIWWRF